MKTQMKYFCTSITFQRKISVYDLDGNFKRSLKRDDELLFLHLYNFNQTSLITNNYWVTDKPCFHYYI